jgi:phosphatidate cytidylyltransferase
MPNYLQRIITAVSMIIFMLAVLLVNEYSYLIGITLLCGVGLYEYITMVNKKDAKANPILFIGVGVAIFLIDYFVVKGDIAFKYLVLIIPLIATVFISQLFNKKADFITSLSMQVMGLVYIVLAFCMLNNLAFLNGEYDYSVILFIVGITAASDTGAYIVGVNFGKHPLAKSISPKKSIEGFIGGIITSALVAYIASLYFEFFTLLQFIVIAVCVAIIGTAGDLIESKIKRGVGVKDSSNLLPGHGGFLDRLDSMIFSIAFVYLVVALTQ